MKLPRVTRWSAKLGSFLVLLILALIPDPALAEIQVKYEQLNPANPAWKFKTIPGPSRSDIASGAKVRLVGNQFEPAGADGSVLVNGVVPSDSLDLTEEALLSNGNSDGGNVVIDLGRVQPIAAVASYSWHEWDVDQGSRGPQVYTLYGRHGASGCFQSGRLDEDRARGHAPEQDRRELEWAARRVHLQYTIGQAGGVPLSPVRACSGPVPHCSRTSA